MLGEGKEASKMRNCAVWMRVSTDEQNAENQEAGIRQFCEAHGLTIVRTFVVYGSAWSGSPEYRAELAAMMDDAWKGEYSTIVAWSLDRITRKGAEDALRLIRQLRERDCVLLSVQESWLSGSPEIQDVLVSFAGWMAEQESARRSERTRAGLERARAAGVKLGGRKPGAKDKKPRKRRSAAA